MLEIFSKTRYDPNTNEDECTSFDNLKNLKVLGKGAYGQAYKIKNDFFSKINADEFVIKTQNINGGCVYKQESLDTMIKGVARLIENKESDDYSPSDQYMIIDTETYKKLYTCSDGQIWVPFEDKYFKLLGDASRGIKSFEPYALSAEQVEITQDDVVSFNFFLTEYCILEILNAIVDLQPRNMDFAIDRYYNILFCDQSAFSSGYLTLMPFAKSGTFEKFYENYFKPEIKEKGVYVLFSDRKFVVGATATACEMKPLSLTSAREFADNNKVFILMILQALDVIYRYGICHNDLKPDNIFITQTTKSKMTLRYGENKSLTVPLTLGKYIPKIGDWGLAGKYKDTSDLSFDDETKNTYLNKKILRTTMMNGMFESAVPNYFSTCYDIAFLMFSIFSVNPAAYWCWNVFKHIGNDTSPPSIYDYTTDKFVRYGTFVGGNERDGYHLLHKVRRQRLDDDLGYNLLQNDPTIQRLAQYVYKYVYEKAINELHSFKSYIVFLKNTIAHNIITHDEAIAYIMHALIVFEIGGKYTRNNTKYLLDNFSHVSPESCIDHLLSNQLSPSWI